MPKKTYRSLHTMNMSIPVVVGGREIYCDFKGGMLYPRRINGAFQTSNEAVQKALEALKEFGTQFVLERTDLKENEIMVGKTIAEVKAKTQEMEASIMDEQVNKELVPVTDIKTFNSARSYLRAHHDVPWSSLNNKEAVVSKARELGIHFVDWK